MKRQVYFLRKVRQALLTGSSYSTVRTCVASLVFALLAINCGPPPQGQFHVPETALAAAEKNVTQQAKRDQAVSLPANAIARLDRMPYLRNAFKEPPTTSKGGLDDFLCQNPRESTACRYHLRWIVRCSQGICCQRVGSHCKGSVGRTKSRNLAIVRL